MATNTACTSIVDVCALRVAQLTSAGAPQTGAYGFYSNSPIQVKAGPVNDTQNEVIQRNGCGTIITSKPEVTTIKGSSFSVDLSKWDRQLLWLLTGGTLLTVGGQAAGGIRAPFISDGQPLPCCIEFWARAWDGGAQAVTTVSTPNASYHHFVLPFVRSAVSEITVGEGPTTITVAGVGSENSSITANGPWNDWPASINAAGGFTAAWGEYDDGTIPTAACGLQTVPSGS